MQEWARHSIQLVMNPHDCIMKNYIMDPTGLYIRCQTYFTLDMLYSFFFAEL